MLDVIEPPAEFRIVDEVADKFVMVAVVVPGAGMSLALVQKNHGKQSGNREACAPLLAELAARREDDTCRRHAPRP